MSPDTKVKLAELSELTIGQLAAKYEKLFGEKCRSRNRRYVYSLLEVGFATASMRDSWLYWFLHAQEYEPEFVSWLGLVQFRCAVHRHWSVAKIPYWTAKQCLLFL